jgi:hypothetical protein
VADYFAQSRKIKTESKNQRDRPSGGLFYFFEEKYKTLFQKIGSHQCRRLKVAPSAPSPSPLDGAAAQSPFADAPLPPP